MKKIFLIAGLAGFLGLASQAQVMPERKNDGVTKETRTAKRGDVYQDLNLTADQKAKFKSLNEENRARMEAIRNDNNLSPEQKRAKFDELRQSQKAKREAILTQEQKAKMNTKMEQMKKDRKGNWKNGPGKDRMHKGVDSRRKEGWKKDGPGKDQNGLKRGGNSDRSKMMEDLNLTADQQTKMKALNEEMRNQMQTIKDNSSLTQDQKRTAFQNLMKETQAKRKAILTTEQQAKWDAREKQMRAMRPDNRKGAKRI